MTRIWLPITTACVALGAGFLVLYAQDVSQVVHPHLPDVRDFLSTVLGINPYQPGCAGQQPGVDYLNAAVEPSVAVDPTNSQHLIGVWQQNRWSNGGADGLMTAVSVDGGNSWSNTFVPFSQCSGGAYPRASDPWVTFAPDGTAYQSALVTDASPAPYGVLVSRSSDGGRSWSGPITLLQGNVGEDKPTITADPTDSNYVYAVWDQAIGDFTGAVFARTTDAGASWMTPQAIYARAGYANDNQIVVLPGGTLVNVFVLGSGTTGNPNVAVLRSADHGDSWSGPYLVSTDDAIGVVDARTQAGIRTGFGIPSTAVDPSSSAIYITWEDGRFSGSLREGVALSKSLDGGITWSTPVQVNQVPTVQAFNPTVAVNADGIVAITYYDFRQATSDVSTLPTNYWQIVSRDGGNSWSETSVAGPFDMLRAARSAATYFLGDYQALAASGSNFIPFFVATNSASSAIPSSVFALPSRLRRGITTPSSLAGNGHIEINRHPRSFSARKAPKANHH